jgi:predicted TIM-barrel fold metal-dependent hydrolase
MPYGSCSAECSTGIRPPRSSSGTWASSCLISAADSTRGIRRWKPDRALQRPRSAYVGTTIVFTNSGVFSPAALTGAVLEVGAEAVMFSVDYPYESSKDAVEGFERTTLSPWDREKIAHGNAERILRLT